ncbi:hypothetical protein CIL02_12900 [Prevotella sp. P3-122]|nr:hypothetical protein CIL02_12900 [Prevotella sp. P3-122]
MSAKSNKNNLKVFIFQYLVNYTFNRLKINVTFQNYDIPLLGRIIVFISKELLDFILCLLAMAMTEQSHHCSSGLSKTSGKVLCRKDRRIP